MQTNTNAPRSIKKSFLLLFTELFAIFFLQSCSNMLPDCNSCSSPPLSQLNGRWELLRWYYPPDATGKVQMRKIPHGDNGEPIVFEINQNKKMIAGYSGCNRFFGTITTDAKNAIQIGKLGSTKMMCIENYRMELETDFLNQLGDYRSMQLKDDQLLLAGRSGDVLVFGRRGPQ
jgi:heat shock protein HslJ